MIEDFTKSKTTERISKLANCIRDAQGEVLFIIGAGASAEAGVPTSTMLKKELEVPGLEEKELRKILSQNGILVPHEMPLEAFLTAYQEILGYDWDIDSFLESRLPKINDNPNSSDKYFKKPPLSYALLSHLVKNNFSKHIVSLNFDELFEKALNEELGQSGYERVASRSAFGRFRDVKLIEEDRVFIFKPHGTISYPMTLRSTWESVKKLDKKKFDVLIEISKACKVWVFVGYGFWDIDITPLNHRANALLSMVRGKDYTKEHFIAIESSKFFRKLTDELVNPKTANAPSIYYRKGYSHRIEDMLFDSGVEPNKENRLFIGIVFLALITKGKFTELSIAQYPRILNIIGRQALYIKKIPKLITLGFDGLIKEHYSNGEKFFYLLGKNKDDIIECVLTKIEEQFLNNRKIKETHRNKIFQLMSKLLDEYDITISPSAEIPFLFDSEKSNFITSLESFKEETQKIIEKSSNLYIIAETGEWLLRSSHLDNKEISLIISDPENDHEKSYHRQRANDIKEKLAEKDNISIHTISSCINVHHVTLGLEKKEGIYFYRKGKAPAIQPVKVAESDFIRIYRYFERVKAQRIRLDCVRNEPQSEPFVGRARIIL
jgi:hypothetical protein